MWEKREINWNVAMSDRTVLEETKKRNFRWCRLLLFSERENVRCWDRQKIHVCIQGASTLGNFFFFSCLWSLLGFEVTLSEGGEKAKQKSQQVHIATRTHKNCNQHNLFFKLLKCKEMRRSLGARETCPPPTAWQPQLNTLPLHICTQLQLEERQHERL